MNFDEFNNLIAQFNISPLGLKLIESKRVEDENIIPPPDKIFSYYAIFKNDFVEVRFKYLIFAHSMEMWIIKNQSEYFTLSEYQKDKNREFQVNLLEKRTDEDEIQYASRYLSFATDLLRTELKPIIDGIKWEDISRDWMGYR